MTDISTVESRWCAAPSTARSPCTARGALLLVLRGVLPAAEAMLPKVGTEHIRL